MPFGPAKSGRVSRSRNWAIAPELRDDLGRLLLEVVVAAGVGVVGRGHAVRAGLRNIDLGRPGGRGTRGRPWRRPVSAGLGGHHEAVDRGVDAELGVELGAQRREREEVEVGAVAVSVACWPANVPRKYIPASPLTQRLGGVLPGPAEGAFLVVRDELPPLLEDGLGLGVGPLLGAGHQADVEVVAVEAHVEDVERAHGRPAVAVARRRSATRPSVCILSPRAVNSSHVVGTV